VRKRETQQCRTVSLEEVVFGHRITAEDGKVEVCAGGGCFFLPFGAFLLLFGCGAIVLLIRAGGDELVRGAIGIVMALFAFLGFVLVFGRYRLEIDANSGTYREGNRLLLFFEKTRGSLDEFDTVTLKRHASSGSTTTGRMTTYAIQLSGPKGTLNIGSRSTLEQARSEAKKVATALNLPLAQPGAAQGGESADASSPPVS
jgi:hypothetical protein